MQGADAVHAGFATHFTPRADLPALSAALAEDGVAALAAYAAPLPAFSLAPQRAAIDRCFAADTRAGDRCTAWKPTASDWAQRHAGSCCAPSRRPRCAGRCGVLQRGRRPARWRNAWTPSSR